MITTVPYQQSGAPSFIADMLTREHVLAGGAKLDAAAFTPADAIAAIVGAAGAAAGASSIPVDALLGAIPVGTILNFGSYAPVTVTVADADVNAGETTIGVAALSGPLPAGTVLRFGSGLYARLTANAAAGATSLTVEALAADIPNASTATFPGGTKQARLTAAAALGATALTVDELQFALVDDEVAYYTPPNTPRRVPSGTLVGCTYAELEAAPALTDGVPAGLLWGPAADSDDLVYFTVYDVTDADVNNDVDLLRPGTLIYANHIPNWDTMSSALKTKVRTAYQVTVAGTEV
jgi:hypothetical protein